MSRGAGAGAIVVAGREGGSGSGAGAAATAGAGLGASGCALSGAAARFRRGLSSSPSLCELPVPVELISSSGAPAAAFSDAVPFLSRRNFDGDEIVLVIADGLDG